MLEQTLTLQASEQELAICLLSPLAAIPGWTGDCDFVSVTRTGDELSIVCTANKVPKDVKAERHWRLLGIKGPLDFSLTGVLSSLVGPLSDAGIAVFVISTYNTDYLLLKEDSFARATDILRQTCIIENQKK